MIYNEIKIHERIIHPNIIRMYNHYEDEKNILTDAAKIYVLKNQKVGLVMGELYNMKITTTYDLKMANLMLNHIENKE